MHFNRLSAHNVSLFQVSRVWKNTFIYKRFLCFGSWLETLCRMKSAVIDTCAFISNVQRSLPYVHSSAKIVQQERQYRQKVSTWPNGMDKRHKHFTYPLDGQRQHLRLKQLVVAVPPKQAKLTFYTCTNCCSQLENVKTRCNIIYHPNCQCQNNSPTAVRFQFPSLHAKHTSFQSYHMHRCKVYLSDIATVMYIRAAWSIGRRIRAIKVGSAKVSAVLSLPVRWNRRETTGKERWLRTSQTGCAPLERHCVLRDTYR